MKPSGEYLTIAKYLSAAVYLLAVIGTSFAIFQSTTWLIDSNGPIRVFALASSLWLSGGLWRVLLPSPSISATLSRGAVFATATIVCFGFLIGANDWSILIGLTTVNVLIFIALDLIISIGGGPSQAGAGTLGLFSIGAAAPIWMGPYLSDYPRILELLIWTNPFVCLAVQAKIDLFRIDAIYTLLPIGGLRYSYPTPELALSMIFGVVLALLAVLIYWRRVDLRY